MRNRLLAFFVVLVCISMVLPVAAQVDVSDVDGQTSLQISQESKEDITGDSDKNGSTDVSEKTFFSDIHGHWAENYINLSAEKGIFKGDDRGRFNPDENITRAQFVTVLWRIKGSVPVDGDVPFEDVEDLFPEFRSAIAWAYANGYINGEDEKTFNPEGSLTREAAMKILHQYSGGESGTEQMLFAVYDGLLEDSGEISAWAKPSVYWGIYNEIISGTAKNRVSPNGIVTRAQLAKIIVNYINTYK